MSNKRTVKIVTIVVCVALVVLVGLALYANGAVLLQMMRAHMGG
jgi:hypothetical protein